MADAKVSALTAMVSGDVDPAADYIYVVDSSEGETGMRKMLISEHFKAITVGTAIYLADGAVGTPSLTNTGDTNTGLYFGAADELDVTLGGTKAVAFTATTLDAIGTTLRVLNSDGSVGGFQAKPGGIGLHNLAIGGSAGAALNAGTYNTLIGESAGKALTDANHCIAIGRYALENLTTGHGNIAIGYECLEEATDDTYNVAIGYQCMDGTTTGSDYNVAIGYGAMGGASMTTADRNVAIGDAAGYVLSTGDYNVMIGGSAALNLTTGSSNVFIGRDAGRYYGTGSDALTDPENSIYIGNQSRALSNSDNYSIVIGYNVAGLGANTCVIGATAQTIFLAYGAHRLSQVSAPAAVADNCFIYAADQTAGNTCPHILTENNKTLKLYQGAAVADATDAPSVILRLNELLAHLRLMGVIAT